MAEFVISYQKTSVFEGDYSNDSHDQGGETYKGISRKFHPEWGGWSILDSMTDKNSKNRQLQSLVNSFYYNKFWMFLKCEKFDQAIADELFDTGVNQGKITVGKYLQESLNLLNNNQKHYKDISVDGKISNKTINAYKEYMNTSIFPGRSKEKNINTLLKALNGLQFERYKDIVKRSPDQEIYFYGWLQRVKKNEKNIKVVRKENLGASKWKQERHRDSSLAGRRRIKSIPSKFNKSVAGRIYSNGRDDINRGRRNSLNRQKGNNQKVVGQNKTEKEIDSLVNFWLRLNIKLDSIINFLTLKK
jgi:lysozyme family protein